MPKVKKSRLTYKQHKLNWESCEECSLCSNRNRVVFARGTIPSDVVFIGEAPGHSENTIGKPFVGPAGKLLDSMIDEAYQELVESFKLNNSTRLSWSFYNAVSCIPMGDDGAKTEEPPEEALEACMAKLDEFLHLAKPRGIVLVGKIPSEWVESSTTYKAEFYVSIIHPADILRADVSQQGLLIQRATVQINDLLESVLVPF